MSQRIRICDASTMKKKEPIKNKECFTITKANTKIGKELHQMRNIVLPLAVIFVIPSSSSAPICTGCQIEQKGYTSRMNLVGQLCQTGGQRTKCGRRRNILWYSAKAWPPNLSFEKLFSKRKKCFKLKLRENSYEIMVNNCN